MMSPDALTVSLEKVEALRNSMGNLFAVSDTTLDYPKLGHVRFRGHFQQDPADCFDELRDLFEQQEFTPLIRKEDGRLWLTLIQAVAGPGRGADIATAPLDILVAHVATHRAALDVADDILEQDLAAHG